MFRSISATRPGLLGLGRWTLCLESTLQAKQKERMENYSYSSWQINRILRLVHQRLSAPISWENYNCQSMLGHWLNKQSIRPCVPMSGEMLTPSPQQYSMVYSWLTMPNTHFKVPIGLFFTAERDHFVNKRQYVNVSGFVEKLCNCHWL